MNDTAVVVRGTVRQDGSLELREKISLPAGDVQVTVRPLAAPPQPERFWRLMETIWSNLRSSGRTPRTREQIDAELRHLRDDAEEEMRAVEQLHEECRRAGDKE